MIPLPFAATPDLCRGSPSCPRREAGFGERAASRSSLQTPPRFSAPRPEGAHHEGGPDLATRRKSAPKFDPEAEITAKIIAAIEAGTLPWRCPWTGQGGSAPFPLRHGGEGYRGINVLMLWLTASEKGYASAYWMTYRQAQEMGAQVRKGETSTMIVKYGTVEKEDENGEEVKRAYLKAYRVFCADQIDGLPESYYRQREVAADLRTKPIAEIEAYFAKLGATIETTDEPQAYYHPARDVIHMPPIATFHEAQGYYETLGHESVHWVGGPARLDRIKKFQTKEDRAREELVAEIGQCMLFASIGLVPTIDQSAAYVESWLTALKNDKKAIFKAAREAQKAVDYITERCGSTIEASAEGMAA